MTRLLPAFRSRARLSASGANDSLRNAWLVWRTNPELGARPFFPPEVVVQVKALACELPAETEVPLSRFSRRDLAREVVARGIVAQISGATIWRWLDQDAIRPWQHRSWIFPRDPQFEQKAGRVLDLYQGCWQGQPLGNDEFVISADEKTRIQARVRLHPTQPPQPGQSRRVEFEYERGGALAYLAAWDVRRAKIFGYCDPTTGIAPFDTLVQQVMSQEPYRRAKRVFWIVDNGSSHRGQAAGRRLQQPYANLVLVHLPVHASWLNQVEIYFSVVQRKVLTPNDFPSLDAVAQRLLEFQSYYEQIAKPFQWRCTRVELRELVAKLETPPTWALAAGPSKYVTKFMTQSTKLTLSQHQASGSGGSGEGAEHKQGLLNVHHGFPGDANGNGPFRPARSRDGGEVSTVAPTGTTRLADAHATPSHNAPPAGTGCSPRLATSAVSAFGTVMVPGGACPPARLRPVVPSRQRPSSQQGRHRPGTATVVLPWGAVPMGALP